MDAKMITLIANGVLLFFVVMGFLFGLKGIRKSGLSLAFFFGALITTVLITPLVSKLLLQIPFVASILDNVKQSLSDNAVASAIATPGSNVEALIDAMPQMILNLATFMVLLIVVGLLFKIPCAITARILKRKREEKNLVGRKTPANVSATGDISYVRNNQTENKHRLLGGLVGAIHGFVFLLAFLTPILGIVTTAADLAFEVEPQTTTAMITLEVGAEQPASEAVEGPKYTALARMIQESVGPEALEYLKAVDNSILCKASSVGNVGDVLFNSVAKCRVNGEKIVLKKEIQTAVTVYNDVSYLMETFDSEGEFTPTDLKQLDFNRLRHAIDSLFDSKLLTSIAPELGNKYLDWALMDTAEYNQLDPEVKNVVNPVREMLDKQPNLKELIQELQHEMEVDEGNVNKQVEFIKNEFHVAIDLAEIFIKSDAFDAVLEEEIDTTKVLNAVKANNNKLVHDIINKIFESRSVNLVTLTGVNYGIDAFQNMFDEKFGANSVKIAKITLASAQNGFDSIMLCNLADIGIDLYDQYKDINMENLAQIDPGIVNGVDLLEQNLGKVGKFLDSIKDMAVLNEFKNANNVSTFDAIIENLEKVELETVDDEVLKITDVINISLFKKNTQDDYFKFEDEFKGYKVLIRTMLDTHDKNGVDTEQTLFDRMSSIDNAAESIGIISDAQIENILNSLSDSDLLRPLYEYLIDLINKTVMKSVSEEVGELNIDTSNMTAEEKEQVVEIIVEAKDMIESFTNGDNLETIITDHSTEISSLLEKLGDNHNNEGVFQDAYDAVLAYATDEANGLKDYVDANKDAQNNIDWAAVVAQYLAAHPQQP